MAGSARLASLLLVAGCSSGGALPEPTADLAMPHGTIQVTLQPGGMIEDIDRFDITLVGGGGAELMLSTTPVVRPATLPPALTFVMNVPADRAGAVTVTVFAVDGSGKQVAMGSASVTLVALGQAELSIVMNPL